MNIKHTDDYEVLTPSGFQSFEAIKKTETDLYIHFTFTDETELKVTAGHLLKFPNGEFLEAAHILEGDALASGHIVKSIDIVEEFADVYDLINVENGSEYYTNGIVSHNCAFIDGIEQIWLSAQQTLATGGSCIAMSTPNGTGNWFYKTWVDAEEGRNKFNTLKLKWDVHPERTIKWREEQEIALGKRGAAQECDCGDFNMTLTILNPLTEEIETVKIGELYELFN